MTTFEKYANLKVPCPNEDIGCSWKGLLKELDQHGVQCEKKMFREAIINIQMLGGRLDQKDREMHYVKNDFALKVEGIAKEKTVRKKEKLEKIRTQTENLGERLLARVTEVQEENVKKNEEIEILKNELIEVKAGKKEENQKLEEIKTQMERFTENVCTQIEEFKGENVKQKEEIKNLKEEMEKLKTVKDKENQKLKTELQEMKTQKQKASEKSSVISATTHPTGFIAQLPHGNLNTEEMKIFFDLTKENTSLGRVVIALYFDKAPESCAKVVKLCNHQIGGISYKGSIVNCINNDFCVMGASGSFIYPGVCKELPPQYKTQVENLSDSHNQKGIVTLYVDDEQKTLSGFRIMLKPYPSYDGKLVIFGKVTEESWPIVEKIAKFANVDPKPTIHLSDCGVMN